MWENFISEFLFIYLGILKFAWNDNITYHTREGTCCLGTVEEKHFIEKSRSSLFLPEILN